MRVSNEKCRLDDIKMPSGNACIHLMAFLYWLECAANAATRNRFCFSKIYEGCTERNMSDKQIQEIAEKAKIIVSGYAFSMMENGFISILNLKDPSLQSFLLNQMVVL